MAVDEIKVTSLIAKKNVLSFVPLKMIEMQNIHQMPSSEREASSNFK